MKYLILFTILGIAKFNISNKNEYLKLYTEKVDSNKLYKFKVKLIKKEKFKTHCGIFSIALAQKFEILEADFPDSIGRDVILIKICPELLGKGFFSKGKIYLVEASLKPLPKTDVLFNKYETEKLPIFWINKIQKITN